MRVSYLVLLLGLAVLFSMRSFARHRGDRGFAGLRGEFRLQRGTFAPPQGVFRVERGAFTVARGTFLPTKGFIPERGSMGLNRGAFSLPVGVFKASGEFKTKPGTFYLGHRFLNSD